ncbi:hypothetical protein PPERSA_00057 [Pseudocohnilembus persalinus]|uniref:Uncharacterized protein n=1 Tax=Pseudocohnilembus persalinus TaxID=266149 RepID=A0A0V0Q8R8_PSEPJ|nr:hypothetical protein PPERSA_00057 [Pseudocohnilembus persalinus]|eukprot:KRW98565.1 hypothetical protein PPERSA_00057 [Pseudocohnilembus persalinus]
MNKNYQIYVWKEWNYCYKKIRYQSKNMENNQTQQNNWKVKMSSLMLWNSFNLTKVNIYMKNQQQFQNILVLKNKWKENLKVNKKWNQSEKISQIYLQFFIINKKQK